MRAGATAWADSGRYTSTTDVDLTDKGVRQVAAMAAACVGAGKLIDPSRLTHVFASPRTRAQHTLALLLAGARARPAVTTTDAVAEWQYGDYEGQTAAQIVALRKARGLDVRRPWCIWRDGCEGGE